MEAVKWTLGPCLLLAVFLGSVTARGAAARVIIDRHPPRAAVPGFVFPSVPRPAVDDAARDGTWSVVEGRADPTSGGIAVLADGRVPEGEDQPAANFFFEAGTDGGRIRLDLGDVMEVLQVNSYSWHGSTRAAQVFTLYGSDGTGLEFDPAPTRGVDPASRGWSRLAAVDTRPRRETGGQYGVSIRGVAGSLGRFRYLLWDCARTERNDASGNTFFGEIDVVRREALVPAVPGAGTQNPRGARQDAGSGFGRTAMTGQPWTSAPKSSGSETGRTLEAVFGEERGRARHLQASGCEGWFRAARRSGWNWRRDAADCAFL